MTYNRKEIMTMAWAMARQDLWSNRLPASHLRGFFAGALVKAWSSAKTRAANLKAAAAKVLPAVAMIRNHILALECKDRLSSVDYKVLSDLQSDLTEAYRREFLPMAA